MFEFTFTCQHVFFQRQFVLHVFSSNLLSLTVSRMKQLEHYTSCSVEDGSNLYILDLKYLLLNLLRFSDKGKLSDVPWPKSFEKLLSSQFGSE